MSQKSSQPDQLESPKAHTETARLQTEFAHVQVDVTPEPALSSHVAAVEHAKQRTDAGAHVSAEVSEAESPNTAAEPADAYAKGTKTYNAGYVYATVFTTAMGSLLFGYVLSAFNPIRDFCKTHAYSTPMRDIIINLATSFVPLGAGVGAVTGGKITSVIGRRKAMFLVDIISLIATVLTLLPSEVSLVIGRFIQGWCAGANSSIVPLYINEVAPSEIRGTLGTYHQLLVTCGFLLAPLLGLGVPAGNGDSDPTNQFWRIVLALVAVPPIVRITLSLTVFPEETPKYLVATQQDEKAQKLLRKIYKGARADQEFVLVKRQVELESRSGKVTIKEIISPLYRKRLLIGILLAAFSQLTGANGLTFFSNDIFKLGAAPNSRQPTIFTVIMNAVQVVATYVASLVIEKSGRKLLLLFGMVWLTVVLAAFSIIGTVAPESPALKWFIWAFMIGFGLSMGPLPWVYLADILPDIGLGIAGCSNWFTTFLVGIAFPPIASAIGTAHAFFIFTGCTLIGTIFILVCCHETKGKTQAEIGDMFNKRTSATTPV